MDKEQITKLLVEKIKEISGKDVTLDSEIADVMDSLDYATLAVDLVDVFPEAKLIEDNDFFAAKSVEMLVDLIVKQVQK